MLKKVVKIATRQSPLAIWQAQFVQYQLMTIYPNLQFELLSIVSEGDIHLDSPLMKVGGKGLFIKELEVAILENRADLAVHSIKDVPGDFPQGLGLVTICKRGDPRDAFVSNCYNNVDKLPKGSIVGTSSLRRQCQISAYRPDLVVRSMRGNVDTRLNKLDSGEYDAIILAAAGLKRLGLKSRIRQIFSAEFSLPTVGQGAVGIECRLDDTELITLLKVLHHSDTAVCICAERAMNKHLDGGCQVPIGSFAILKNDQLWLRGLVGTPDGRKIIVGERYGPREEAAQIGVLLAEELLKGGARAILCANY